MSDFWVWSLVPPLINHSYLSLVTCKVGVTTVLTYLSHQLIEAEALYLHCATGVSVFIYKGTFVIVGKRRLLFRLRCSSLFIWHHSLCPTIFQAVDKRPGKSVTSSYYSSAWVRFTPYPAPKDRFWPLKIRIKAPEPGRLRIKLIFKNNTSFHIFSSHLDGAGNF